MEVYGARFADPDGKVRASFDIIWLSGWSPHASQQQPLRPGSAKARLADALGTAESAAGEKPERRAYLDMVDSASAMLPNSTVLMELPIASTVPMMARLISAAIRPYSIAVVAFS